MNYKEIHLFLINKGKLCDAKLLNDGIITIKEIPIYS